MTVAELILMLEPLPPTAAVHLETDTIGVLSLIGARLDLYPDAPARVVLEGVES